MRIMALSLEQLTAAFKKQDTKESRPSNYYRFWDMAFGEQAIVRFVPDGNDTNPLGFIVEKFMHNLTINGENKSIPCLKMYDEECPICKVSSAYYADEGKESVNGKKYWRKKQHIIQALVVEDPLPVNPETGVNAEGKVMFLNFGFQLYSVIKEAFESGELDQVPYFFEGGCDFIIKKVRGPDGNAKYDVGSKFARRSSDLTDDEIAVVQDQSVDLSTLIPPNPTLEKVEAMLEAALTGAAYSDEGSSAPPAEAAPAKQSSPQKGTEDAAPAAAEFTEESDDILALIRDRKKSSAE